jgi:hypothetical protein
MGKRQKQYPKGALVRLTNDEHMRLKSLAKRVDLSFSRFLVESGLTGQAPTNEDKYSASGRFCSSPGLAITSIKLPDN